MQTDATETGDYVIPYLRLDFNLGTAGLKPFVELDGDVRANDFRSLSQQNPYLADALWLGRSAVDYNGRFGIGGSLWRNRFAYRLYAAVSVRDNHPYWYSLTEVWGTTEEPKAGGGPFMAALARQTVTSLNFEAEYRPVSQLSLRAGVHARAYNDESRGSYAFSPDPRLKLDRNAGTFAVCTPQTECLVLPAGELAGRVLRVKNADTFMTVAAISLDGRPLAASDRILVIHLTDLAATGMRFSSGTRTRLLDRGTFPLLLRRGTARIELASSVPLRVAALKSDGSELGEIKGEFRNGRFSFRADTAAFPAGVMAYLLSRNLP